MHHVHNYHLDDLMRTTMYLLVGREDGSNVVEC